VYGIGVVARMANVSVRTLRHYDDIGLLEPAEVDPATGYRRYAPEQLHRLHRILVLRDLGVPLGEIGALLADGVTVEQLRGILRLRQAEVRARLAAQTEQLARVEARLAQLDETMEGRTVTTFEIIVKRLDALRVVGLTEDLTGPDEIAAAGGRLWTRLHAALGRHGIAFTGLSYALYEDVDDPDRPLRLTAALPVPAGVSVDDDGIVTFEVPAVERAATTVVRGAPTQFHDAFTALHEWVERHGERATVFDREVYLDCDGPPDTWVTELQTVLEPGG
jgi:DNA-binding transcriptional MerR regulator